ncbi:unnamed protein product [Miscanthus lutarioriparius]|uniref:Uncharacterized protein n=1 Tax=Miscanthus lutarioriparius TaxID=422564 RepID=A0A811SFP9_9POAL|nr:unnamed protein product [Miscanthus lutarioriparius]
MPYLDARERHAELLLGDEDGPLLPAVAEHLLCVDEPAPCEDLVPDALRRSTLSGDDGLLGSVEVGHEDPRGRESRLRLGVRGQRGEGRRRSSTEQAGLESLALRPLHCARSSTAAAFRGSRGQYSTTTLDKNLSMPPPLAAGPAAFAVVVAHSPQPPL